MTIDMQNGARTPSPRPAPSTPAAPSAATENSSQSISDAPEVDLATASTGKGDDGPKVASVEHAIEVFDAGFTAFRSLEGQVYVVDRHDPSARPVLHTGGSRSPAVALIAERILASHDKFMKGEDRAALGDYIGFRADKAAPRPVLLRSAWNGWRFIVDIGDDSGRVIVITAEGWHATDTVPPGVHLRRSSVTAALPTPARTGDLDALWTLVPVTEADRPLVLALLLSAWMTGTPQPVVFITGPQDAAKTTTARYLLRFADPVSNVRGRSLPTSEPDWKAAVNPYLVVLIDNVSGITAAQSDMLCKVSTGGEATARALYTNADTHITSLQASLWLTSIGVGALRGDLGSRLVRLEMPAITPERRRSLSELEAAQDAAAPAIMRGLLDLAVEVLGVLPTTDRTRLRHRLTDFEVLVRAIDSVMGTSGADRLAEQAGALAEDVLDGDVVAQALLSALEAGRIPDGRITPKGLLDTLTAEAERQGSARSTGWPRTPRILTDHLVRIGPALESAAGVTVTRGPKLNGVRAMIVAQHRPAVTP
ncbi:hypothetical protein [Quadrisphaera setariae]|uniref:ATP-binding protein n=1 Tax=Quadrisphaera setariae TaxID=2593304 RepID=A0A5C8ZGU7_9ACTN|nr:hypothetical protein [Quadrisphaera setariae]TXR56468.1 hypothetical protein FMM08_10295 [Quadrisphaera setariae]